MIKLTGLTLSLLFSISALAVEKCQPSALTELTYFNNIQVAAVTFGKGICEKIGGAKSTLDEEYAIFSRLVKDEVKKEFQHVIDYKYADDEDQSNELLSIYPLLKNIDQFAALAELGLDTSKVGLPTFNYSQSNQPRVKNYGFTLPGNEVSPQINPNSKSCTIQGKPTCTQLLKDLKVAIAPYKRTFAAAVASLVKSDLIQLSKHWDRMLDEGRSQTWLDLLVTSSLEHDAIKKNYFVKPPEIQWFLMHPSVVLENLKGASDGENDKIAVAIEWFGMNFWDKHRSPIGYPIGASLASVYTDRPEVNDVGHGLMFHIGNSYSIGWAYHGGNDNSVYVSMDLMKLFEDKKAQYSKWEEKINIK